jgi:hypothetical protein
LPLRLFLAGSIEPIFYSIKTCGGPTPVKTSGVKQWLSTFYRSCLNRPIEQRTMAVQDSLSQDSLSTFSHVFRPQTLIMVRPHMSRVFISFTDFSIAYHNDRLKKRLRASRILFNAFSSPTTITLYPCHSSNLSSDGNAATKNSSTTENSSSSLDIPVII